MEKNSKLLTALQDCPLIAVLVMEKIEHAQPVGEALVKAGIKVAEVTLRTPNAPKIVTEIRNKVPEILVGTGTVMSGEDVNIATDAGAEFLISPGVTDELVEAMLASPLPSVPGTATPSEAMHLANQGFEMVKVFPIESLGGTAYLKSLSSVLPKLKLLPTGGITKEKTKTYLELPNVYAAGGSWIVTRDDLKSEAWEKITARVLSVGI